MVKLDIGNCDNIKRIKGNKKGRNKSSLVPQHKNGGFRWIINGSSGSGKSNLICWAICKLLSFDRLYIYSKHLNQPKFQLIKDMFEKIQEKTEEEILFMSNSLDDVVPVDELDGNVQNLVIFDDFLLDSNQTPMIDYFVRSRHKNCSVCFLGQRWSSIPRVIRVNCNYISLFAVPSKKEINLLYSDIGCGLDKEEFIKKFKKYTKKPYDFLFIDCDAKHPSLQYRCCFNKIEIDNNLEKQ